MLPPRLAAKPLEVRVVVNRTAGEAFVVALPQSDAAQNGLGVIAPFDGFRASRMTTRCRLRRLPRWPRRLFMTTPAHSVKELEMLVGVNARMLTANRHAGRAVRSAAELRFTAKPKTSAGRSAASYRRANAAAAGTRHSTAPAPAPPQWTLRGNTAGCAV